MFRLPPTRHCLHFQLLSKAALVRKPVALSAQRTRIADCRFAPEISSRAKHRPPPLRSGQQQRLRHRFDSVWPRIREPCQQRKIRKKVATICPRLPNRSDQLGSRHLRLSLNSRRFPHPSLLSEFLAAPSTCHPWKPATLLAEHPSLHPNQGPRLLHQRCPPRLPTQAKFLSLQIKERRQPEEQFPNLPQRLLCWLAPRIPHPVPEPNSTSLLQLLFPSRAWACWSQALPQVLPKI